MCAHQIAFHTPEPPKLNVDLASLSGGGVAPSQFCGETHDGRDVYVRYRGGHLSIQIGTEVGEDALDGERLLDVDIGPAYDGSVSLSQFCTYFGAQTTGPPRLKTIPMRIGTPTFRARRPTGRRFCNGSPRTPRAIS